MNHQPIDEIMATAVLRDAADGDTHSAVSATAHPDEAGYAALPDRIRGYGPTDADALADLRIAVGHQLAAS